MRKTRRSGRKMERKSRRMVYRRRRGGAAMMLSPAGLDYKMEPASLKQGQEFAMGTKDFHGGAAVMLSPAPLDYKLEAPTGAAGPMGGSEMMERAGAGPMGGSEMMAGEMMAGEMDMAPPSMPMTGSMQGGAAPLADALSGAPLLPEGMHASARIAALDKHFDAIKGMSDMDGGRRRRRRSASRKASRKGRKASRKASRSANRKASRSASRKGRKASRSANRKGRKASRRTRQRGGAALNPADIGAEPMLLKDYSGAGLNAEWKVAADPDAYKPRSL